MSLPLRQSRTAKLAACVIVALVLCQVELLVLVHLDAPRVAYRTLEVIAWALAGGGGLGTLAHGVRYARLTGPAASIYEPPGPSAEPRPVIDP